MDTTESPAVETVEKPKRKVGRPTKCTPERTAKIAQLVASG